MIQTLICICVRQFLLINEVIDDQICGTRDDKLTIGFCLPHRPAVFCHSCRIPKLQNHGKIKAPVLSRAVGRMSDLEAGDRTEPAQKRCSGLDVVGGVNSWLDLHEYNVDDGHD